MISPRSVGACRTRPGGRRVLRRRRLGVPGLGRPRHARPDRATGGHRGVAVAGRPRARRLPRARRRVGARLARGRDRRDGERRLPAQRHRPLLLVQGRADGRGRPAGDAAADGATVALGVNLDDLGDHRPGQRAAAERGAVFPLVEAGFTKDDVRSASRAARPAHVGQAGGAVPRLAPAVRHAGHARPAASRSRPPRPRCARSASTSSGSATTASSPASRSRSTALDDVLAASATRSSTRCRAAGYRWVTLDLDGLRSGQPQPDPLTTGRATFAAAPSSRTRGIDGRHHQEARRREGRRGRARRRVPRRDLGRARRRRPTGWSTRCATRASPPATPSPSCAATGARTSRSRPPAATPGCSWCR